MGKKKEKKVKVESGQTVSIHYVGTFEDGTEFDNSREREEAMSHKVGSGFLLQGFEDALPGMAVGDVKKIKLEPEQAYGEINPEAFQTVPHHAFPPNFEFKVDGMVQGQNQEGQALTARIDSVKDSEVILDFNHPLAGKTLNFEIELLDIKK